METHTEGIVFRSKQLSLRHDQSHASVLFAGEVMKSTLNFLIRNEVTKECYA